MENNDSREVKDSEWLTDFRRHLKLLLMSFSIAIDEQDKDLYYWLSICFSQFVTILIEGGQTEIYIYIYISNDLRE